MVEIYFDKNIYSWYGETDKFDSYVILFLISRNGVLHS